MYYTGSVAAGTVQNVDCSDASSISFSIYIPDIDEWDGSADQSSWSLNNVDDERCEPTFDTANNLVEYSDIDAAICDSGDPSLTSDDGAFEFKFVISVDAVADGSAAPATFAYDHNYIIKCFYNREQENIMASFEPRHSLFDSGSGKSKSINLNSNQLSVSLLHDSSFYVVLRSNHTTVSAIFKTDNIRKIVRFVL